MHATQFLLSFLAAAPGALAWGTVGHATVAAIANNYLTTQGKAYVVKKLGQGVSMESIASWADNFRYTSAGRFSAPYQYVSLDFPSLTSKSLQPPP